MSTQGRAARLTTLVVMMLGLVTAACDKVPLLAPTSSTLTLTAPTRTVALGGTVELSAYVAESSGTPVQNGTTVRFTTSLGSVNPVEAQTRNGIATAVFSAGQVSGTAQVRATSGPAGSSTDTGTGENATTAANVLEITIGAANATRVVLSASPSSVPSTGGSTEVAAQVLDVNGNPVSGVTVTFSTNAGSLSASSVLSDAGGVARTTLTTNRNATVTARAGSGADQRTTTIDVAANIAGSAQLTCQGSSTTASGVCTQVENQAVVFTASRASVANAAPIASATLDFGEGPAVSLGNLASPVTASHVFNNAGNYIATLRATDINGETSSTSVSVSITQRTPIAVSVVATPQTVSVAGVGNTVSFDADVTPAADAALVVSYTWDFGDGTSTTTSGDRTTHVYTTGGRKVVTVTVRTQDGRTATTQVEFIVPTV